MGPPQKTHSAPPREATPGRANPRFFYSLNFLTIRGDVAQRLPVKIVSVEVRKPDDLDSAFGTLARERVQGEHRRISALAAEAQLHAIWSTRIFSEAGGLISRDR
jgi:hypothetical protein